MLFYFLSSALADDGWKAYSAVCKMVKGKPTIDTEAKDKQGATAWATFNDSIHAIGWYQFHVEAREGESPRDIMLCAGALEGYLSHDHIYNHFVAIKEMNDWRNGVPANVLDFAKTNMNWVRESVEAYRDNQYWRQVGHIYNQFEGIVQGFEQHPNKTITMSDVELYIIQAEGDINDAAEILPAENGLTRSQRRERSNVQGGSHCSGLIKLLKNYTDIFFSHAAWSDYRDLYGELKEYNLPIEDFHAQRVVISTRIGMLSSYDDFYMNDKGLFILETTMNNFNEELEELLTPRVLFTWLRATVATWTATGGEDWTKQFSRQNSGTYNNEYLVIDSNKFVIGEKPEKDLLWIVEQFPGIFKSKDITEQLVKDTYFPSFNTPYFEELYEYAHYPKHVAEWGETGNYWTYYGSARYNIFARDAPRVDSFEDFQRLMTYNDYTNDPYSNGDPGQQILSRYDLRPVGEGSNPLLKKRPFGGLDAKCLRLTEAVTSMRMHARASPPYENGLGPWVFGGNPYFNDLDEHWPGIPTIWQFNWTIFESDQKDLCNKANGKGANACWNISKMCGWCTYDQTCMAGEKSFPWMGKSCEAGWQIKSELPSWSVPVIASVSVIVVVFCATIYGVFFYNSYRNKKNQIDLN